MIPRALSMEETCQETLALVLAFVKPSHSRTTLSALLLVSRSERRWSAFLTSDMPISHAPVRERIKPHGMKSFEAASMPKTSRSITSLPNHWLSVAWHIT